MTIEIVLAGMVTYLSVVPPMVAMFFVVVNHPSGAAVSVAVARATRVTSWLCVCAGIAEAKADPERR